MGMIKYTLFTLTLTATIMVWVGYFNARSDRYAEVAEHAAVNIVLQNREKRKEPQEVRPEQRLTQQFWEWEAQGRLNMIDTLLAHTDMVRYRKTWNSESAALNDLVAKADILIAIQNKSYGVEGRFPPVTLQLAPLRGDANGLYVPQSQTIFLNSRMDWQKLSFERFVEVVLHENMHHIMTRMGSTMHEDDGLYGDFASLTRAAYFHDVTGMAQDHTDVYQANLQELVAWRTQRAARYAGIFGSDLTVWDMSARTQEIRNITKQAGF